MLRVTPGDVLDRTTGLPAGQLAYPFGVVPRLLVTWMATEAVRTHQRELILGGSLSTFLRAIGLTWGAGPRGPARRLEDQMTRLLHAQFQVFDGRPGRTQAGFLALADQYELWWSRLHPSDNPMWKSTITLSERFFSSIVAAPVPIDLRALRALRGSPLRLDIYTWLTYRLSYLRKQTTVPWEALAAQFGGDYHHLRQFRAQFIKQLRAVRVVYPLADLDSTPAGLVLRPSPTHVPRSPSRLRASSPQYPERR
jgi:hypothetical protein